VQVAINEQLVQHCSPKKRKKKKAPAPTGTVDSR
jgi:hypothetical protein